MIVTQKKKKKIVDKKRKIHDQEDFGTRPCTFSRVETSKKQSFRGGKNQPIQLGHWINVIRYLVDKTLITISKDNGLIPTSQLLN